MKFRTIKKKSVKIIALSMSALIMLAVMPFYASAAVDLTVANVVEYPTASDIYSGQAAKDSVLSGGRVEYNGVEVPGHFEHVDPEDPIYVKRYNIKFVPDDTTAYNGFTIEKCKKVSVTITPTMPVISGDPPTASAINYGDPLRYSTISFDGKLVNPYNENDPKLEEFTFEWEESGDYIPQESAYFRLRIRPKYATANWYKIIDLDVWVEVIPPEIPFAEIITYPTIDEFTYNENYKWGDFELKGGEANVPGKFEIAEYSKDVKPTTSALGPDVVFTPDDQTKTQITTFRLPVKINRAEPYLISEDGSGIPTIRVPYLFELTHNDFLSIMTPLIPKDVGADFMQLVDMDNNELPYYKKILDVGLHELEFKLVPKNKCYVTKMMKFKLLVEPLHYNALLEVAQGGYIIRLPLKTNGTFDIYFNGELILEKVKATTPFPFKQQKSGPFVLKAVYNGEDSRIIVPDIILDRGIINLEWQFIATGMERSLTYKYGEEVVYTAPATDSTRPDKPYYAFSSWEVVRGNPELTEEQLKNAELRFKMPDEHVELKANYKFSFKMFFDWLFARITEFFVQLQVYMKAVIELLKEKV